MSQKPRKFRSAGCQPTFFPSRQSANPSSIKGRPRTASHLNQKAITRSKDTPVRCRLKGRLDTPSLEIYLREKTKSGGDYANKNKTSAAEGVLIRVASGTVETVP